MVEVIIKYVFKLVKVIIKYFVHHVIFLLFISTKQVTTTTECINNIILNYYLRQHYPITKIQTLLSQRPATGGATSAS